MNKELQNLTIQELFQKIETQDKKIESLKCDLQSEKNQVEFMQKCFKVQQSTLNVLQSCAIRLQKGQSSEKSEQDIQSVRDDFKEVIKDMVNFLSMAEELI